MLNPKTPRLPRVIFEDQTLIVFDKPPGLVVTSSETVNTVALEDILKKEYGIKADRGGIVHRLDKDTSGLLVVAKTDRIMLKLQAQFKERLVAKEYLALVHGWVKERGKIEAAISRNPKNREKFIAFGRDTPCKARPLEADEDSEEQGREAVTEYEPIQRLEISEERLVEIFAGFTKNQIYKLHAKRYTLFTLLKCHPQTGRTHQIRVHLKYIGFPIVADDKYGGRKTARLDRRWCPRQFLHAAKLEFDHPRTLERMKFESPLPDDLKEALGKLEGV